MANRKSVVEIDIQDSKWKRFLGDFQKFRVESKEAAEDTAETAIQAARVAAARKQILDHQAKIAKLSKEERAELELEAKAKAKVAAEDRKSAELKQKLHDAERKRNALKSKEKDDARKERDESIKGLRDSAKWTFDIARNVASTAASAAKWVAFSAIASGFGLGGLAANASTVRRTSQGLGIRAGELRAANVNFGRYIDPESALSNIANTKDSNDRWIFNRVGVNTSGKDSATILAEYLPKVAAAFKAVGGNTSVAEATGLTKIVSAEDLRRLSSLTEEELKKTIDAYQKDRKALEEGDSTGRAWQDFMVSLHRAGDQIEVSLLKGLTKLTPYLEKFADGIAKAIGAFVESGGLQSWIEKVGEALKRLGGYLGSKEFADDVETFMGAIHTMASYLAKLFPKSQVAAEMAQGTVSSMPDPAAGDPAKTATFMDKLRAAGRVYGAVWDHVAGNTPLSVRNHNPGNLRVPGSATDFQKFASDDEGIKAIARQLSLYENRDGLTTLRSIISKYSPSNENNTAALIANASKRTGFGADQQLDSKSVDQMVKLVLAITKQENGASNFTAAGVRVLIENNTGGNSQASVAALSH